MNKKRRRCYECGKPSFGFRCRDCFKKDKGHTLTKVYNGRRRNPYIKVKEIGV